MSVAGALAAALATYLVCIALLGVRLPLPVASRRTLALCCLAGITGVAVGALAGAPLAGALAGVAPWWWDARLRATERERTTQSAIAVLDGVVAGSRSGLVLPEALAHAAAYAQGELAARLDAALARMRLGDPPASALATARAGASERADDVLAQIAHCARSRLSADGVAAYLDDVLGARRFERQLEADVRARTAGQRFQVWLLAAVVPGLALYLAAMSPTLAEQLASPLGRTVLVPAGLAFELAGIVASRRALASAER